MSESEDARFRRQLKASWNAVFVVARYLHSLEGLEVKISPLLIREDQKNRAGFGDDEDLMVKKLKGKRWRPIEVKWRQKDFVSAATFEYQTIFVDRVEKADKANPYAYFIVNRAMTHAAVIKGSDKDKWIKSTKHDPQKGYEVHSYECDKNLFEYVNLLVNL